MRIRQLSRTRPDDRGATAVIVAITMAVLISLMAIAIDFSAHTATRTSLQNAADEAAVAAATACQNITPASARVATCGRSEANAVVSAVDSGASVTTQLVSGSAAGQEVRVKVDVTFQASNPLVAGPVGSSNTISVSSTAGPRTAPNSVQVGPSRCSRSVDTGLGVSTDGNVYAWGYLFSLGGVPIDGGTRKPPQRVPLPEGQTLEVCGQIYDANALDTSGHVWGWGTFNFRNGTEDARPSNAPEQLRVGSAWDGGGPLLSNITMIATSEQAGAGVDTSGAVWVWGDKFYGGNQADGATKLTGLPDPSLPGNMPKYIKGAYNAIFIVLQNGDVYYAGSTSSLPPGGGLSLDTATKLTLLNAWTKSTVTAGSPYVVAVDGGINMGGAVLSNGQFISWSGSNDPSRTGRNGTGIAIVPGLANIVSVQFGFTGVALLDTSNSLWGYGASDDYGRFPLLPVQVDTQVRQYASGQGYYIWQRSDGTFWARGYNPQGALGLPIGTRTTNTQVLFGTANALSIIAR